jgi:SurA-like N-terminal domain
MSSLRPAIVPLLLLLLGCSRPATSPASSASPTPGAQSFDGPLPSPVPDVVARVNGVAISLTQILPMAREALDRVPLPQRDTRKPGILRRALHEYVDRELLMQEALARGVKADTREVEWAYDQMHNDHPDEAEWTEFLAGRAMDPQSLRAELRVQYTVAALLAQETRSWPVTEAEARAVYDKDPSAFAPPGQAKPPAFEEVRGAVETKVREQHQNAIREALIARLRAKARIELYL